jgi:hypothetical protein
VLIGLRDEEGSLRSQEDIITLAEVKYFFFAIARYLPKLFIMTRFC